MMANGVMIVMAGIKRGMTWQINGMMNVA